MRLLPSFAPFLFILFLFFTSCEADQKNELIGEWYINPYHSEYVLEATNEHSIVRLYPKGIFTQFGESGYCTGTWKRNEKGNYLHFKRKQGTMPLMHEFVKIESLQSGEMTAGIFYDLPFHLADRQMIIQLLQYKNKSGSDPYTPALQTWRLRPQQPESDVAIRKRVENYLHFLRSMYKHAIDNNRQAGNNWYPSPLRMDYGNGVRMAYSTEIGSWYQCFYDSAQAVKGYQVISEPVQNITLLSGVTKPMRNLDCVEQLLKKIEL